MNSIHPSAVISPDAVLGDGLKIGPFAIIEKNVKIANGCSIGPHAHLQGYTDIGADCRIFTGAVIGSITQDLKYRGGKTYISIGGNTSIREYVTINPGTAEGESTLIGENNLLMAYAHIAHNCEIGNNVIIANAGTLAGHVKVEDYAIIGGLVGIHQFCRVGAHSIVGGCSKVTKDIMPFVIADGYPARPHGINITGLKRRGFPDSTISKIKSAYKIVFRSGLNVQEALDKLLEMEPCSEIESLTGFISSSNRGIAR